MLGNIRYCLEVLPIAFASEPHVPEAAKRLDEARGVPRGAAGQLLLLENHHALHVFVSCRIYNQEIDGLKLVRI